MVKPQVFANAATSVLVVAFVVCGLLGYVAPDLLAGIANSWVHTLNLDTVRSIEPMSLSTFIYGVVTFGAYVWVLTYAIASVYNKLSK